MKSISSQKQYMCIFLILLIVMQNVLQKWIGAFQYVDELFALLLVPFLVYRLIIKKEKLKWTNKKICFLVFMLIFWLCGWGGYLLYHYQPLSNTIKDAYVNLKFFMAVGASFLIFSDEKTDFEQLKKKIWPILNMIVVVLFVFCLADLCFGIFSTETRAGMRAIKLFYSTYTILVGECVFLSAIFLWFFEEKGKRIIPPLAMLAFIMLSTRRVKAVGAIACVMLVYLMVFYQRKQISNKIKVLVGGIVVVAVIAGLFQVIYYYCVLGSESARGVLTLGAPFVAKDHFPFGSGWGTYGSAFSIEPYSPVYGMYHMEKVWGMSENFHSFISDTFWPMIMGQTGFFGFAAYVGAMVVFARKIYTLKTEKNRFASGIFAFLYLLISSTSESAFVNPIAIPLAFWMGLLFAEQYIKGNGRERVCCEDEDKADKCIS